MSNLGRAFSRLSVGDGMASQYNPTIARLNPMSPVPIINVPLSNFRLPVSITDKPTLNQKIIESPTSAALREINSIVPDSRKAIIEPESVNNTAKHAIRMIVIRRRKMKKHKLKKLRKKMKFEWGRLRQRREMRREKAFQAGLIAQIKEAEKFSAEQYVADKLRLATESPIPRFYKGKRLPQFIIKDKLNLK